MENYVRISLETHLFFARIMKEHALFLQAGFVGRDKEWIQSAEFFRCEFEKVLRQAVRISNGLIGHCVLCSEELFTPFTIPAEQRTSCLSGIPVDSSITEAEKRLQCGCSQREGKAVPCGDRRAPAGKRGIWIRQRKN